MILAGGFEFCGSNCRTMHRAQLDSAGGKGGVFLVQCPDLTTYHAGMDAAADDSGGQDVQVETDGGVA